MKLSDWIFFFTHGFRYEAKRMHPEEARFLESYFREQTLAKPCQVEAMLFSCPYRVALLFFLDPTKQDLKIHIQHEEWSNLEQIATSLLKKYPTLPIKPPKLRKLLEQCKNCQEGIIYGIDVVRNVLLIYFTHDPRKKVSPLPLMLNYSKPQDVAEMAFRLNPDQTSSYFIDKLWEVGAFSFLFIFCQYGFADILVTRFRRIWSGLGLCSRLEKKRSVKADPQSIPFAKLFFFSTTFWQEVELPFRFPLKLRRHGFFRAYRLDTSWICPKLPHQRKLWFVSSSWFRPLEGTLMTWP